MELLKKKAKGFTLIELLVVIAIIGILSSIVLVSVNTARNKAKDAAVKSNLANLRVAAELFYDTVGEGGGTYTAFCANTRYTTAAAAIQLQNGGTAPICNVTAQTYCISSVLVTGGASCVDSTGKTGTAGCAALFACP